MERIIVKRDVKLDIMRGLAITSVVVGHCTKWPIIEEFVNQYHLAVFFFVSGYFFSTNVADSPKSYLWKKVKQLYFPFVISGGVFLLLHNLLVKLYIYPSCIDYNYIGKEMVNLIAFLYSNDVLMGAMWFCISLLWVLFVATAQSWVAKKWGVNLTVIIFSSILISSFLLQVLHLKSPYCIWQNIIITGILWFGFYFRGKIEGKIIQISITTRIFVLLFCFISICIFTLLGISARLQGPAINNECISQIFIVAVLGCLMAYFVSSVLCGTYLGVILSVIGRHSFSIMLLNYLCFNVINCVQCMYYHYPIYTMANHAIIPYESPIWFLLYIIAGTAIPVLISICYKKVKFKMISWIS